MRVRTLVPVMVLALAACGGGAGTGVNPPVGDGGGVVAPTPTPTAVPGNGTSSTAKVRPSFVSPATTQLTATVNTVNGGTPGSGVQITTVIPLTTTGGSPNCVVNTGVETCTVSIPAPVGTVNYTFTTSDGTHDLGKVTSDETIALDTANTLTVTIHGIVNSVSVSTGNLTPQATYGSYPQPLTVTAYDASGNAITGTATYANPVTLTDPDTAITGSTGVAVNGGGASAQFLASAPTDTFVLNSNGLAINSFTFGTGSVTCVSVGACNVTSNTPYDITFAGTTDDSAATGGSSGDVNWGQQTVFFAQAAGSQDITASEVGFTGGSLGGTFTAALDAPSCGSGPGAVASVNPGPATSFTINALNVGLCKVKLTERSPYTLVDPGHTANTLGAETHDGTFWISVTSALIGINHTKLHH